MQTTTTRISTAQAIATLACTDLAAETMFFRDTLGFDVEQMRGATIVHCGQGTSAALYERPTAVDCDTTAMTFLVEDLDTVMSDLKSRGVKFEEYDLPYLKTANGVAIQEGVKSAWFKDPAGNILSIVQM
jgi:catechol 2,3-dioxygenase-like lactoylglutathione lyase family enzyme